MRWRAALLVVSGCLIAVPCAPSPIDAQAVERCPCLDNGGQPGPEDCLCDVGQCYHRCVDELCPGTPNCTIECTFRCECDGGPPHCPTHEDPRPTPTPIPGVATFTATRTPTPVSLGPCAGDCNGDGSVAIDELMTGVEIALGEVQDSVCLAFDTDHDGVVSIAELLAAVGKALRGCPYMPTSTPTPSATSTAAGFRVCGCVDEFPYMGCGMRGITVTLNRWA
jgi:hypothetical protein